MKKFGRVYLLVVLVFTSVFELSGNQAALLFFFIAVQLWVVEKKSNVLLPPVLFIVVAYSLGFLLPFILPSLYPNIWLQIPRQDVEYAMLWAVRGFGAFGLGYSLIEFLGSKHDRIQFEYNVAYLKERLRYTIYVITSIGWLALLAWITKVMLFGVSLTFIEGGADGIDRGEGTLTQILSIISSLRDPFFFGFLILTLRKNVTRHLKLLFVALLFISAVEIITIGSKESIIRVLLVMTLVLAFVPLKLGKKQLLLGALTLVLIYGSFAVITEYRSIMRVEQRTGKDVFSWSVQTEAFTTALLSSLPFSESFTDRQTLVEGEDVFRRFGSGMFSFANLLRFTHYQSPYENAWESVLVPMYSVIPRYWLPDKPVFFHSGRNAKEYYRWSYGGISVTLLGSFYFAWGYIGIVIGMVLLGGLLGYLARQLKSFGILAPHSMVLVVLIIVALMNVGVIFQSIFTNVIRISFLLMLLYYLYPIVRGIRVGRVVGNQASFRATRYL